MDVECYDKAYSRFVSDFIMIVLSPKVLMVLALNNNFVSADLSMALNGSSA